MLVLLWILVILAAGAVALLSIPVELSFHLRRDVSWGLRLSVRWMFGLVRFPVSRGAGSQPKRKRARPPRKRDAKRVSLRLMKALLQTGFRRRLLRFLYRTLAAVRLRDFWMRIRLGFDDPAETGYFWAVGGPLIALLPRRLGEALDIAPEFAGAMLEVETRGKVRVIPAQFAWLALSFVLSPVTLRTAWVLFVRT